MTRKLLVPATSRVRQRDALTPQSARGSERRIAPPIGFQGDARIASAFTRKQNSWLAWWVVSAPSCFDPASRDIQPLTDDQAVRGSRQGKAAGCCPSISE